MGTIMLKLSNLIGALNIDAPQKGSIFGNFGAGFLNFFVWIFDCIMKFIYVVAKFVLNIVDFLQYFCQKLVGLDVWNKDGVPTLEELGESDIIFKFMYHDGVQKITKYMMGIFFVLLIIFTIFSIIKSEYKFATADDLSKADNSKSGILRRALKAIFLVFAIPLFVVLGLLSSNAILASIINAINQGSNQTFGGHIFNASSFDANKYRNYAQNGIRIPISNNVLVDNKLINSDLYPVVPKHYGGRMIDFNGQNSAFVGFMFELEIGNETKKYLYQIYDANGDGATNTSDGPVIRKYITDILHGSIVSYDNMTDFEYVSQSSYGEGAFSADLHGLKGSTSVNQAAYNTWYYNEILQRNFTFEESVLKSASEESQGDLKGYTYTNTGVFAQLHDGGTNGLVALKEEYLAVADVIDYMIAYNIELSIVNIKDFDKDDYYLSGASPHGIGIDVTENDDSVESISSKFINVSDKEFVVNYNGLGNVLYQPKLNVSTEEEGAIYIFAIRSPVLESDGTFKDKYEYIPLVHGKMQQINKLKHVSGEGDNAKYKYAPTTLMEFESDVYASNYNGVVVARGIFESTFSELEGRPTQIINDGNDIKFKRAIVDSAWYWDFSLNILSMFGGGATWRWEMAIGSGFSESESEVADFIAQDGRLFLDYNFVSDVNPNLKLETFFIPSKINVIILLFASIMTFIILGKAVWGLIARVYDILLYFIIMPGVVSATALDGNSMYSTWQSNLIKKIFGAYGTMIGLNLFFVLLKPIKEASNLFTQEELGTAISKGSWLAGTSASFVNSLVFLLFMLVALTLIQTLPGTISDLLQFGNIVKDGEAAKSAVKSTVQEVGKHVSGQSMVDLAKNSVGTMKNFIPGSAVYKAWKDKKTEGANKKSEKAYAKAEEEARKEAEAKMASANEAMENAQNGEAPKQDAPKEEPPKQETPKEAAPPVEAKNETIVGEGENAEEKKDSNDSSAVKHAEHATVADRLAGGGEGDGKDAEDEEIVTDATDEDTEADAGAEVQVVENEGGDDASDVEADAGEEPMSFGAALDSVQEALIGGTLTNVLGDEAADKQAEYNNLQETLDNRRVDGMSNEESADFYKELAKDADTRLGDLGAQRDLWAEGIKNAQNDNLGDKITMLKDNNIGYTTDADVAQKYGIPFANQIEQYNKDKLQAEIDKEQGERTSSEITEAIAKSDALTNDLANQLVEKSKSAVEEKVEAKVEEKEKDKTDETADGKAETHKEEEKDKTGEDADKNAEAQKKEETGENAGESKETSEGKEGEKAKESKTLEMAKLYADASKSSAEASKLFADIAGKRLKPAAIQKKNRTQKKLDKLYAKRDKRDAKQAQGKARTFMINPISRARANRRYNKENPNDKILGRKERKAQKAAIKASASTKKEAKEKLAELRQKQENKRMAARNNYINDKLDKRIAKQEARVARRGNDGFIKYMTKSILAGTVGKAVGVLSHKTTDKDRVKLNNRLDKKQDKVKRLEEDLNKKKEKLKGLTDAKAKEKLEKEIANDQKAINRTYHQIAHIRSALQNNRQGIVHGFARTLGDGRRYVKARHLMKKGNRLDKKSDKIKKSIDLQEKEFSLGKDEFGRDITAKGKYTKAQADKMGLSAKMVQQRKENIKKFKADLAKTEDKAEKELIKKQIQEEEQKLAKAQKNFDSLHDKYARKNRESFIARKETKLARTQRAGLKTKRKELMQQMDKAMREGRDTSGYQEAVNKVNQDLSKLNNIPPRFKAIRDIKNAGIVKFKGAVTVVKKGVSDVAGKVANSKVGRGVAKVGRGIGKVGAAIGGTTVFLVKGAGKGIAAGVKHVPGVQKAIRVKKAKQFLAQEDQVAKSQQRTIDAQIAKEEAKKQATKTIKSLNDQKYIDKITKSLVKNNRSDLVKDIKDSESAKAALGKAIADINKEKAEAQKAIKNAKSGSERTTAIANKDAIVKVLRSLNSVDKIEQPKQQDSRIKTGDSDREKERINKENQKKANSRARMQENVKTSEQKGKKTKEEKAKEKQAAKATRLEEREVKKVAQDAAKQNKKEIEKAVKEAVDKQASQTAKSSSKSSGSQQNNEAINKVREDYEKRKTDKEFEELVERVEKLEKKKK